jgi:Ser/Thr protein kinase RdoA (MazF antagonist)
MKNSNERKSEAARRARIRSARRAAVAFERRETLTKAELAALDHLLREMVAELRDSYDHRTELPNRAHRPIPRLWIRPTDAR